MNDGTLPGYREPWISAPVQMICAVAECNVRRNINLNEQEVERDFRAHYMPGADALVNPLSATMARLAELHARWVRLPSGHLICPNHPESGSCLAELIPAASGYVLGVRITSEDAARLRGLPFRLVPVTKESPDT